MDKDTKDIIKFGMGAVVAISLILLGIWFFSGGSFGKALHRHGGGELHSH